MIKTYTVYFEQVNATYVTVTASNPETAKRRAEIIWKQENPPVVADVEMYDGHAAVSFGGFTCTRCGKQYDTFHTCAKPREEERT